MKISWSKRCWLSHPIEKWFVPKNRAEIFKKNDGKKTENTKFCGGSHYLCRPVSLYLCVKLLHKTTVHNHYYPEVKHSHWKMMVGRQAFPIGFSYLFRGSRCWTEGIGRFDDLLYGTVDGSEIRQTHQLRLVVYPIIYRVYRSFIPSYAGFYKVDR